MWNKIKKIFEKRCSDCGAKIGFFDENFYGCQNCVFNVFYQESRKMKKIEQLSQDLGCPVIVNVQNTQNIIIL